MFDYMSLSFLTIFLNTVHVALETFPISGLRGSRFVTHFVERMTKGQPRVREAFWGLQGLGGLELSGC